MYLGYLNCLEFLRYKVALLSWNLPLIVSYIISGFTLLLLMFSIDFIIGASLSSAVDAVLQIGFLQIGGPLILSLI